MKKLTKILCYLGFVLMFASFILIYAPLGVVAAGLWTFCFVYDEKFRRMF